MTQIETNIIDKDIDLSVLHALSCQCLESGDVFIGNVIFDKPHGPGVFLMNEITAMKKMMKK